MTKLVFIVIFYLTIGNIFIAECKRSSGGSRRSYSRPSHSYSHPSHSYSHPSPSHSPSYHSPAYQPSSYHNSPAHTSASRPSTHHSSPSHAPSAYHPPAYKPPPGGYPVFRPPTGTRRPIGFQPPGSHPSGIEGPPKSVSPVGNSAGGSSNSRPIGFVPPGSPGHSNGPVGPPKTVGTQGNAPLSGNPSHYNPTGYGAPPAYTPHNPAGYGPPAYTPHNNPAGYGAPPAYHPGYSPGYGQHGSGNYHAPGTGGVTIINNNVNNHHYGGGYGYGGYQSYHYSSVDTGSGDLGFFLGYSLAKLTTPSYHYHVGYSSYSHAPVYDHYEVHHYYHNNQTVPKEAEIQQNAIVGCVGDAGSFCPANTTSLCTNNGAVMCVASATSTVPCSNEKQTNCVKSTIPCLNSSSTECAGSKQNTTTLSIPCISTAKVYGSLNVVNNTIAISNATAVSTDASSSNAKGSSNGSDDIVSNSAFSSLLINYYNELLPTTTPKIPSTTLPETTTPNILSTTANSTNSSSNNSTEKKDPPQVFCVTILALPAERKPSETEVVFNSAKGIFEKFAVKALGID